MRPARHVLLHRSPESPPHPDQPGCGGNDLIVWFVVPREATLSRQARTLDDPRPSTHAPNGHQNWMTPFSGGTTTTGSGYSEATRLIAPGNLSEGAKSLRPLQQLPGGSGGPSFVLPRRALV